ncbi:DNA-processing protein DprA [Prevotella sp.]|uniref:DNA-processing protein DprA n=1 Tax=Prevotella sp. TaxID=59823 RepID=UPI002F948B03
MPDAQELFHTLVLARLGFWHIDKMQLLYREIGSASAIMEHSRDIRALLPKATPRMVQLFQNTAEISRRVEDELRWAEQQHIDILTPKDPRYPLRLAECVDAPLALYFKGTADLNARRVICVVGTRHSTAYGHDLITRFTADLKALCPDVLIVSGLAYGVDIHAHREALRNGLPTVGILAHGLDTLYPPAHRETATAMTRQGGLLTEYTTHTNADKANFVRRNRIVAGMSDACVLVESAARGGGLITASMAQAYNRDVFAFPGAVGATYSEGCNQLIRTNGAGLITSAEDLIDALGWRNEQLLQRARREGIERQLFSTLTPDEQRVADILATTNDLTINQLAVKTEMAMADLSSLLFRLEMQGHIRALPGGIYHLIR